LPLVEFYTASPPSPSKFGILILTDIIGHRSINAQLVADDFACRGYNVMMPDLFAGDPVPLNGLGDFDISGWLDGKNGKRPNRPPQVDPIVEMAIAEMRKRGSTKVAGVGYCFGGKYVARFLGKDPASGGLDAGFTAHPSYIAPEELAAIKGPFAIAASEIDSIFPAGKRRESEDILSKTGQPWQICLYSGVKHGFGIRADISIKINKVAKEGAFEQAVQWFRAWVKEG
jgi:dienelactone hydrolase